MRTPGERTSGAWTGGCAIHPDGGDETDRTAGNSYTATPHNTQGANSGQVLLQPYGEPVTDCRAQPSLAMEAAPGQKYSVNVVGVYSFPKKASEAITAGADVYWDNTNGVITATAESNILAGYAIADAAAADAVVSIKINA